MWPGNRAPEKPIETFPASDAMQDISSGWERTATSPKRTSCPLQRNRTHLFVNLMHSQSARSRTTWDKIDYDAAVG